MSRDIPVGNGNLLIAFDKYYRLAECYFPNVGHENHCANKIFRIGVFINQQFSWIDDTWEIKKNYLEDTLITDVELINRKLNIKIKAHDLVDFEANIYLKKLILENLSADTLNVSLFFCQEFQISGTAIGDTAAYRPEVNGVLHYKNDRYFLINAITEDNEGINQYACGEIREGILEGAWKDAEDGMLSNNPIAQGSVDSVIAINLKLAPGSQKSCFYWISAGNNWNEVVALNQLIKTKTPQALYKRTDDYWKLWVNKEVLNSELLPEKVFWLYKMSLLILRTQINNCGSIIAANDSDNVRFNRDTYSYMWPRDAAMIAYNLDLAGYSGITRNFFSFCKKIIENEGYFLHKYSPAGTLASSWHPWIQNGKPQLPIQEDETALVIWALWHHYTCYKDIEFIKPFYETLVKKAANFMLRYRDPKTNLPLPSYDLWEERQGILTFTTAAVYAGLKAAANFATAFGENEIAAAYSNGAEEIKTAMLKYLYLEKEQRFARMINFTDDGAIAIDPTLDASLFAVFAFEVLPANHLKVQNTIQQVRDKLWCRTNIGGLARYENDSYHRINHTTPGNPWFITTLWLAKYYIAIANKEADLLKALDILEWASNHSLPSGVLSEQINPATGEELSVSPLSWSHGTFIGVVQEYLKKMKEFTHPAYETSKYEMTLNLNS